MGAILTATEAERLAERVLTERYPLADAAFADLFERRDAAGSLVSFPGRSSPPSADACSMATAPTPSRRSASHPRRPSDPRSAPTSALFLRTCRRRPRR